jgi:hypothetical protein
VEGRRMALCQASIDSIDFGESYDACYSLD